MPAPPGEAGRNALVVNTEVDYRDEDDLTQTDIGHGAGGSINSSRARAKEQRERLDLLTQRNQLKIKLDRVENTNQVLSRQNTYLSSLLPRHYQQHLPSESDHSDPSSYGSTSSPKPPPVPTIAQLHVEIVDLKRENNALRYTFFGETPSAKAAHPEDSKGSRAGGQEVKKEETSPIPATSTIVEQGTKIAGQSPTSVATLNPTSNSTVDLRAVLRRVKDLHTENMELAGLLVGASSSGSGKEDDRDGGQWAEVVRESRTMITSLDADLEIQSQEIVSLRSRIKELETELELERARKQRMKSMSRSRSRSRARSVSRGRSMSRSRSRSMSRSGSRSRGRSRSRTRSPSASRSASRRNRSESRRSPSRSRSRHRDRSSSPRDLDYRRDSRSDRRRYSSPGRSPSPRRRTPEGSQRSRREMDSRPAAVPPPRSTAGGSNWRTAHGISDDEDTRRGPIKQVSTNANSAPAPVTGGFSILGASARSAPRELLPSSPRREDRDPPSSPRSPGYGRTGNRRGDSRNQGSRGGGRGRGGRSRSPRRDEVRDVRDRSRQRQSQGRWREEDRYRPESGRRPSVNERLDAPLPDGRNGRRRGGRRSRPRR